jgi:hypothetical protein
MHITPKMFWLLGIDPIEGVRHVEAKKAVDVDPEHVLGLMILRPGAEASIVSA